MEDERERPGLRLFTDSGLAAPSSGIGWCALSGGRRSRFFPSSAASFSLNSRMYWLAFRLLAAVKGSTFGNVASIFLSACEPSRGRAGTLVCPSDALPSLHSLFLTLFSLSTNASRDKVVSGGILYCWGVEGRCTGESTGLMNGGGLCWMLSSSMPELSNLLGLKCVSRRFWWTFMDEGGDVR